ncbi:MAG: hypothetical protein AAF996_04810 [Pseudomonadota bacterium]
MNPKSEISAVLTAWASYFLDTINPDDPKSTGKWRDARNKDIPGRNSIIDSEILLTFLVADAQLDEFGFDCSSQGGSEDVKNHPLYRCFYSANKNGKTFTYWNERVKRALKTYFIRNSNEDGRPTFASDSYLEDLSETLVSLENIETVDSYSFSLTTALYAKLLAERLKALFAADGEDEEVEFWSGISSDASDRISGALVGLISSFSVSSLKQDLWEEATGRRWPEVAGGVRSKQRLETVRSDLRAMGYSISPKSAFEIGWSWGPIEQKYIESQDRSVTEAAEQRTFSSENAPYLYFTINALDGIADLATPEIESGGILDSDQLAKASLLKSMAAMTSNYWMAITTADQTTQGPGRWEIETLPWRTADGQGSLYWNLFLSRLIMSFGTLSEAELSRFSSLAERMGESARITTPPFPEKTDQAISAIHYPGLEIELFSDDYEDGTKPAFRWLSFDFSAQLLKLVAQISKQSLEPNTRQRLLDLTDRLWRHLERRCGSGVGKSWDLFSNVYPNYDFFGEESGKFSKAEIKKSRSAVGLPVSNENVNSWYMTERVQEALVGVAIAERQKPRAAPEIQRLAISFAQEAQWWISTLEGDEDEIDEARRELEKCRELIADRPSMAFSRLITLVKMLEIEG